MEARIQYAQTQDGVSIAFASAGEGLPLVNLHSQPYTNVQFFLQSPFFRAWIERLAQGRRLILMDGRGTGLSQREVTDFSLDARVLELEAVADRLGLERFALMGMSNATPVAVAYAARHPERVSHLLLWEPLARGSDYYDAPRIQALVSLMEKDWGLFAETAGHIVYGWSPEESREFTSLIRESLTQSVMLAFVEAARSVDVTPLLTQIAAPTLVVQLKGIDFRPDAIARGVAARIPDARLVVLEAGYLEVLADPALWGPIVDEFLGEGEKGTAQAEPAAPGGLVSILFTDIESSSALRQQLGDAKAQELVRVHNTIVREALKAHAGSEIKHTGDGIMASFGSALGALECAVAVQRGVAGHVAEHADAALGVYVGLNAGEPIAEEQDLFGTSVDLARRLCDEARPGEILVSDVVRQLAAGKDFLFADRGDVALRGFEDPVRVYEVRWRD